MFQCPLAYALSIPSCPVTGAISHRGRCNLSTWWQPVREGYKVELCSSVVHFLLFLIVRFVGVHRRLGEAWAEIRAIEERPSCLRIELRKSSEPGRLADVSASPRFSWWKVPRHPQKKFYFCVEKYIYKKHGGSGGSGGTALVEPVEQGGSATPKRWFWWFWWVVLLSMSQKTGWFCFPGADSLQHRRRVFASAIAVFCRVLVKTRQQSFSWPW